MENFGQLMKKEFQMEWIITKKCKKLLNVAHEQFNKVPPEYALCIFLGASAIEEVGKGVMMMEDAMNGIKIITKRWNKNYVLDFQIPSHIVCI